MAISPLFQVRIVNAEEEIFSGKTETLSAHGLLGEIGILPGHAPLLTELVQGPVWLTQADKTQEVFYISGGLLQVRPGAIVLLADTVIRAKDLDEARAINAKKDADDLLSRRAKAFEYAKARVQLNEAIAHLRTLKKWRGH